MTNFLVARKRLILRLLTLLVLVAAVLSMVSCAQNSPWRTEEPVSCPHSDQCATTFMEVHENYTLGYVEFSDRGNEFSRERTDIVLDRIRAQAETDSGVAIITFVHGWLHNASNEDGNVASFRSVLDEIGRSGILGDRQLFGVYVGWRGKSLHGLGSQFLTYWNRKAVAEQVGYNGVSPLIQRLSNIDHLHDKTIFAMVGHSFGGAMTLSAVDDVLLSRMLEGLAKKQPPEPLGEGIILINPAIEANQILSLKEQSSRFSELGVSSDKLLHIVSSKADKATHVFFPLGQSVSGLTWRETDFTRDYQGLAYNFSEKELDRITIGNYSRFWTNSLSLNDTSRETADDYPVGRWLDTDLCSQTQQPHNPDTARLPCTPEDPLDFLITDASFIKGHSDIFNENVAAYLTAVVAASVYAESEFMTDACTRDGEFVFNQCFNYLVSHFSDQPSQR